MAHERVGKRVRVYWSEEEEWFEGTIQELNQSQGYYIVYDDGDERWESEGQPMLVEGEEEAQTAANYEELRDSDRTPQMMEPPASPGSDYDDDYEGMEQSKSHQQPEDTTNHTTGDEIQQQHEVINYSEDEVDQDTYQQEKEEDQQDHSQSESKDDHAENGIEDHGGEDVDDTSDDQSVAESEMPKTFGKTNETTGKHRLPSTSTPPSTVPVPVKGMLEGRVLRATGLQTSRALAPNAFVRVSFVESGDATHASAMLRCKETLSTTGIVRGSVNPVWSEDLLSDDNQHSRNDSGDGGFQLELLPRIVPPGTKPAWHQLPGDVLFTIFSASRSDGSRNGANEHIGQATISLRSLLQDLLTVSPFTTRVLELRSRSGKRLGYGNTSTRSLFDDGRAEAPTLVASFKFIPTYESKIKPKVLRSVASASRLDRLAPAKTSSRAGYRQDKAKRTAPAQMSSSCINRRRFEKQVAKDNRSFAKRLEWKEARRTRRSAQAKAQEKKKVTPPQYGARKHGHKAHSGINRTKFVHQIAAENKAIGRRLQNILGTDDGARNPEKFSSWAAAEPKDSLNYDYMDRDKLHAQDKRWQRQVELDFLMEKAQTKYQQQHQMVEEVMEIQEAVATLKTQVDTLNKSVLRLDILNKKDQHVRDCLLRAAVTSGSSAVKASPRQPKTLNRTSSKPSTQNNNNDHDDGGKNRKEQELELLTQHRDRLQADKHRLSYELNTLNQQELELDKEMNDQQSKWEYAIATQLFHRQMDKKNAIQAQQAVLEMKRRLKALELSREEEEQWVCYQARQELTQLQFAIQILRDQNGEGSRGLAETRASKSSSTAVCEYLTKKIEKQKSKLQQLQDEVGRRRNDYEVMLVSGGNESLRRRVQELQKLVFLCKSQATHVKKAERIAKRKGEQVDMEFQRRLFSEQTETEIMFKRVPKQ
ncbi:hypothetical protein PC116_g9967 [Phytophthora cactorum]|uniref:C2 domain-containing protein n=1 Tax=Phytophthora cactorum TaxID=29920 RepID=A0A329T595_9STRA|nr:hypothetical protein Pcac1_g1923 [Phytophthora cactorum]KAG2833507.1 hypothetical protein PC111_g6185 [Phytophthora cactorum]KAG2845559.1 hypothetical protein PC112_g1783 [Phytophthora cactorum]KAG2867929.1 hypothetical protein PC113_g1528 [Phytophthora cactorum]KAG2932851.1 hypothetical protein PC114_g1668 [Phytophthora cactorum]